MSPKLGTPDIFPRGIPSFTETLQENLRGKNTLPKTNIAPENGWLEDKPFLLGR